MENQRIIQVEDKVPFNLLVPLSIHFIAEGTGSGPGQGTTFTEKFFLLYYS